MNASIESALEGDTLAYLGEIKKDDYSNALFTLDATSGGKQTGVLRISYEDDFGKHEIQKDVIFVVERAETQSATPLIIGIIAVGAVLFFWNRRKHKP